MTPAAFVSWRDRMNLTQVQAAKLLDITSRQLQNYEWGATPVPHTVWLATRLLEAQRAVDEMDIPLGMRRRLRALIGAPVKVEA
jgi:predicted transcriptional regulator